MSVSGTASRSASARAIAVDLTRLITRLRHPSPSGIDRVDLAYARHFLGQEGERYGVVSTAFGPRVLLRRQALAIVEAASAGWVEELAAGGDPVYRGLVASLGETPEPHAEALGKRPSAGARRRVQVETMLRTLRAAGPEILPDGTLYLHTSHLRLDKPERFDWLYQRRDVRPVFFLHDLIPIDYPEYGRPGEAERHRIRIETIARHAAHVLVNSADVGARLARHLARDRPLRQPVSVAPLGVEAVFETDPDACPFAHPTFVLCGTIEPRKNHLTLLNLWRDLAERHGPATPRLVLVGRRGWEAENIIDMLERCPAIRRHVTEVAGLSTHGLVRLLQRSTALLMPSFAEGYGLPVVEGAACGLPVIASDIPVHREIGDTFAHLIDPLDGPGWRTAIESLSRPDSAMRADLRRRLCDHAAPDWRAHFAVVEGALSDSVCGREA